jgi:zinc transport system substrate-binding protein
MPSRLPRVAHDRILATLKTTIVLITAAAAILGLAACGGSGSASSGGRTEVVASFYPLAFAADRIGGARVTVSNLTPAGAEPHDLELSPRDVARVHSADLVLLLGRGFQPQVEDAAGTGPRVLRLLDTPGLRTHANGDPHVWLDPLRYALIARRIGASLHAPVAAGRLVARLRRLDAQYRRGLRDCRRRTFVTSHEAFAYLAERYRVQQVAITGLNPEAEPTPRALSGTIAAVRRTGATTVFTETLLSPRTAKAVARATGAHTDVLDPIEGLTDAEARAGASYFSLMRANLAALRRALGCR